MPQGVPPILDKKVPHNYLHLDISRLLVVFVILSVEFKIDDRFFSKLRMHPKIFSFYLF